MKFKKVLITTDLSSHSQMAVSVAGQLLKDAELIVATIVHLPQIPMGSESLGIEQPLEVVRERMIDEAKRQLHDLSSKALRSRSVTEKVIFSRDSIAHAINQCAQAEHCDLIVIGSHGAGHLESLFVGATAQRTIKLAECAVLVIPAKAIDSKTYATADLKRLVVATDLSAVSTRAVEYLTKNLSQTTSIDLITVYSLGPYAEWPGEFLKDATPYLEYLEQRIPIAEWKLRELAAKLTGCPEVRTRVIKSDRKVSEEVCHYANAVGADCLVLGSQGAGVLENLFLGSTVLNVLKLAALPVLVNPCAT